MPDRGIDSILEVRDLTHGFDDGGGIYNISFSVPPGEFLLLAGPNGSGKTTLIRHFNALLRPDSGRVLLRGGDIAKDPVNARKKVGMVFQDADTQIVGDTVFDEVAFGPENLRMDRGQIREKVDRALEMFSLAHLADRNPATLSGGEKRRLAVAGILVMDPDIIVFDEPFANLDYPSSLALVKTVLNLNRAGHTIIMATHEVEEVIGYAHRLVIMDRGRLVRDGAPKDLLRALPDHGVREPCFSRMGLEAAPWQA